MSDDVLLSGDVIVRAAGALRRLTLNRPKALNALTLDMAETMTRFLHAWAADPKVGTVLLDGAGERGFCAGGDIRALYDAAKRGNPLPERFWATEYRLDVLIERYPKPVIVVMDGLVMGGGIGLAIHASHRVVTERSALAMPEVGIGFYPDVGATFALARAPGYVGTHLALTGERVGGADAIFSKLADIHVPAARLAGLPTALADCRNARDIEARLSQIATPAASGSLPAAQRWIDRCYAGDDVGTMLDRLAQCDDGDARRARDAMARASPTSLKVTLRGIRSAAAFDRVEQSFQQDYRIALACIAGHDFIEGIRAAIVDKDRNPHWLPAQLADVTPEIVERHFKSVGPFELEFND